MDNPTEQVRTMTNPTEQECRALAHNSNDFWWIEDEPFANQLEFEMGSGPYVSIRYEPATGQWFYGPQITIPEIGLAALTAKCKEVARSGWFIEEQPDGRYILYRTVSQHHQLIDFCDSPWAALLASVKQEATDES